MASGPMCRPANRTPDLPVTAESVNKLSERYQNRVCPGGGSIHEHGRRCANLNLPAGKYGVEDLLRGCMEYSSKMQTEGPESPAGQPAESPTQLVHIETANVGCVPGCGTMTCSKRFSGIKEIVGQESTATYYRGTVPLSKVSTLNQPVRSCNQANCCGGQDDARSCALRRQIGPSKLCAWPYGGQMPPFIHSGPCQCANLSSAGRYRTRSERN